MAYWNRRNALKNAIGLLLLPFVMIFLFRWFEHRQVYFPSKTFRGNADLLGQPWEEVSVQATDATRINAWFFPANTNSTRASWVVLLCHGNAGNIGDRLGLYSILLETGVSVLAFDYRGYGRSAGRPSEDGTYLDAEAAYQWLRQKGYAELHIIALGESLGGAVAAELALRAPLGGLILQSTFTSIPDIGSELFRWLPVRRLHSIQYDTINRLPRIKSPVLVAHGRRDDLIGFHHAEKNFKAATGPKMLLEIAGDHVSTIEDGRAEYLAGLGQFLNTHVISGTSR